MNASVVILQPYIPTYRVSFFEQLRLRLAEDDVRLRLVHGRPSGDQQARCDSARLDWAEQVDETSVELFGRQLRRLQLEEPGAGDLIILEQAIGNLNMWGALARFCGRRRVALWGHGETMTRATGTLERQILKIVTLRSDWFFAYTNLSAAKLEAYGYPTQKITVVQNTIDTSELRVDESASTAEDNSFSVLYMGGLDASKGITELLEMGSILATQRAGFRLHIVGDGSLAPDVRERSRTDPWLVYHGVALDAATKAAIARQCKCLVLAGRVGLAVVDAFALGLPVIAHANGYHAPEFAYLKNGENCILTPPGASALASAVQEILDDHSLHTRLRMGAIASGNELTMDKMVANFSSGIIRALRSSGDANGAVACP